MLFLFSSMALATTYNVDFHVVQDAPVNRDMISVSITYEVGPGWSDTTVASDWSYVTCMLKNGIVALTFQGTDANWPTTWPSQVSCSSGGYTLTADVKGAIYSADIPDDVDLSAGVNLALRDGAGMFQDMTLPSSYTWTLGTYDAELNGSAWNGVECRAMHDSAGNPWLRVLIQPDHDTGLGACVLPTSTQSVTVDLAISDL